MSFITAHLVLLGSSICGRGRLLATPPGVSLVSAGGHLFGRPLPQHLVQVEPAAVAHEERTHLGGRAEMEESDEEKTKVLNVFKDEQEETAGQTTNEEG